ncbi:glucose-6-phosphate 1-dehydrogenase [Rhodobium orientis]|uniref:Glucose-6-phosphate 1-dehydrogenase n=1 Tax=Rhodobium orientis TaxID=34017 RepID=A0A327JHC7_9HYPH|nr:glucose-6-phosphate dehydrogenase [Rhodobium orientis]MBB4304415.1 glucose-6-phosphate 1-dehydrogenase [Rhodobium orientis]MBK5952021.1 glucose-6-phosphate dehydrogenase [Rhodobium orientis]RAI25797.1 glucose-6-phosphate dehydrogenase [Rhodobium orientis]
MSLNINPVEAFDLVVFGITGDLAHRKILPALCHRFSIGQIPKETRIIGVARGEKSKEQFHAEMAEALDKHLPKGRCDDQCVKDFLDCFHYVKLDVLGEDGWQELKDLLNERPNPVRAFYLSVAPSLFAEISVRLGKSGIATEGSRIVLEKPFGHDLQSAKDLNARLKSCFDECQIYRIDHYLGKETVQNLMALRFANALFEPLWNSQHIDHVQITVAETLGIAGRGGYYDHAGAMRDMVQNHMMQVMCLIAMEPPARFDADSVRDEKLKVIKALDPLDIRNTVRGQYRAGNGGGSYREEAENPDSMTESAVALKAAISNWRWSGVPFYLRTGKRLRAHVSEIMIKFKEPPHNIFEQSRPAEGNALILRLQPGEGITLMMTIKEPGSGGMRFLRVPLDMSFAETLGGRTGVLGNAYERLIMDVIRGDQTLFMRGDEAEAAWAWVDPVIAAWQESGERPQPYDALGSGPEAALALMHRDGREWREIETEPDA